jgi:hypothetical protein
MTSQVIHPFFTSMTKQTETARTYMDYAVPYLRATYPTHYATLCNAETITPRTLYFDPRYWSPQGIKNFFEDLQVLDNTRWCMLVRKQTAKIQQTRVERRVAMWVKIFKDD